MLKQFSTIKLNFEVLIGKYAYNKLAVLQPCNIEIYCYGLTKCSYQLLNSSFAVYRMLVMRDN